MASKSHVNAERIGAKEAAAILGVGNTFLMQLANTGRLVGKLVKTKCGPPPHKFWQFKRSDVETLKARGVRRNRRQRPPRARVLWKRYYGTVPAGHRPAFIDNNPQNVSASNLHLIRTVKAVVPARSIKRATWTEEMIATLRRRYPITQNSELAKQFDVSTTALRGVAVRYGIRKNPDFVPRPATAAPIGTERIQLPEDFIWTKVSHTGTFRQKWRLKHHIEWEKASGGPLPPKHKVIFLDGNRRNFAPANLQALSINETSARAMVARHTAPKPIRDLQRIVTQIRVQADKQLFGQKRRAPKAVQPRRPARKNGGAPKGERRERWTPDMDTILMREWPRMVRWEVAAQIGVTVSAAFARAKRLNIPRLPETRIAEARTRAQTAPSQ